MKPVLETAAETTDASFLETFLRRKTGWRVKRETLTKLAGPIQALMARNALPDRSALLRRLERDPDALQEIVDALAVNETYFFREPA